VFRVPLQPETVSIGEMVIFYCDVYSNPVLTDVRWRRNDIQIVGGGRYTVNETHLLIQNVREEDDGSYTCEVTNPFGTVHSTALLTIGSVTLVVVLLHECVIVPHTHACMHARTYHTHAHRYMYTHLFRYCNCVY